MLPLDKPSASALNALRENGVNPDNVKLMLYLDLDFEGNFGESWLAFDGERKMLCRIGLETKSQEEHRKENMRAAKKNLSLRNDAPSSKLPDGVLAKTVFYDEYDLRYYVDPYVDNFSSSNRLLYMLHKDERPPLPEGKKLNHEEMLEYYEEWDKEGITKIAAYCTNAKKRRLFAFIDITERILKDEEEVTEDDQIFEQWNAKCPKCGEVFEDQERKICTKCVKKGAIITRMLAYFKPFKLQLATVLLCMFASSALSLVNPIINGKILYDNVINSEGKWHSMDKLLIVIGVIFGMALLSVGVGILMSRANAKMSNRVSRNMKQDVFSAMQRLSLSYFNNNSTGRLMNRVNYDADRMQSFFIDGIPNLIIHGVNFIGLTIFLFSMNWQLTLIVFIPVPIIILIFKFMLPKLWRLYTKQWRRSSSLNSMLGDSLNGIRVVKAFAKEAEETNRFYEYSTRLYHANMDVNLMSLTIFPFISLLIGMSSQAIWGFGGFNVMNHYMTYGEFTTYFGYIGMIFGPLQFFTNFTNILTDAINAAQRMFEVFDTVPDVVEAKDPVDLGQIRGEIKFDKVCFHYNPNRPILKDVSINIHAGDHVGLVGHTGSGKTTIANLITRMYDVISGNIYIDGVNIKNVKVSCLRENMAIVSQEIFLFRGTIADNIRYACPNATMEEIIAAAKAANAHDFITRLPEGYETLVGIGSRSLSGGEKQRISIARALLLAPQLLILDEATAAMDTETERLIGKALEELIQGRTTITIAHRLSTLKNCNYLFAIENGEIAEEGTPTELLERKGVYYKLYTLQNEAMKKVLQGM